MWVRTPSVAPKKAKGITKMNYAEAEKVLKSCGQEHVLAFWKKLSKKEREQLLRGCVKVMAQVTG